MEASVITTYRCHQKCSMCHIWKHPTAPEEEFAPELLDKLPRLSFCNITGGEPFLREDIEEIASRLKRKARRVVISTNGFLTEKIVALARGHPGLGFRISLEGLPAVNDELRGTKDSYEHGLRTLLELKKLGIRDIGFATTVSGQNGGDMLRLHELAKELKFEFATAAAHNSFYFHKSDNVIQDKDTVASCFRRLSADQLRSRRVKDWFRAYFNAGLAGYVQGRPRPLPCGAGSQVFFLDPFGEILPCNGMEERLWKLSLGNLGDGTFGEIWDSPRAGEVRKKVKGCPKNCWMIGTAGPAMKKHAWKCVLWIMKNKTRVQRQRLK
jgi:radical SAM protein with 4Fe4S-binding SPASM domain